MKDPILAALSGERILHSNALATVTENCIVVAAPDGRAHTVLPLLRVSKIKLIKTTHPAFLVIAAALLVIATAAQISAEGGGAAIPTTLLAIAALAGYFVTRRASVALVVDAEVTETMSGSLRQAAALVSALQSVQTGVSSSSEQP